MRMRKRTETQPKCTFRIGSIMKQDRCPLLYESATYVFIWACKICTTKSTMSHQVKNSISEESTVGASLKSCQSLLLPSSSSAQLSCMFRLPFAPRQTYLNVSHASSSRKLVRPIYFYKCILVGQHTFAQNCLQVTSKFHKFVLGQIQQQSSDRRKYLFQVLW